MRRSLTDGTARPGSGSRAGTCHDDAGLKTGRATLLSPGIVREGTSRAWRGPQLAALVVLAAGYACSSPHPPPPQTPRRPVVDTIHGVLFVDPYRWLERRDDAEVHAWLAAQDAYAERVVGDTALRRDLALRLTQLVDADDTGPPVRRGDHEIFWMRRSGEEQGSIYRRPALEAPEVIDPAGDYELLVDPSSLGTPRTTSVGIEAVSPDGAYLVYGVRDGGEDEETIRVLDVDAGTNLPDSLPRGLYGDISWKEDGSGFYYSARDRMAGGRARFHRLGTPTREDETLFGEGYGPDKFVGVSQIADGRYLLYDVSHGWSRIELYLQDLRAGGPPRVLAGPELDARFYPQYREGELYVLTNLDAPNNRILAFDLDEPERGAWREVIPETEDVLQSFTLIDGRLYATYLYEVSTRIRVHDLDGALVDSVPVPDHHTARIRGAGDGEALLTLESLTTPEVTYRIDLRSGERRVWDEADIDFEPDSLTVNQVWYTSKDGTRVPMYVMHRSALQSDVPHPTWLYGYGGFNVSLAPRFDPMAALWVERGGVYAVANLRGGGEFGERWHRAGMLENKQNVFDDFIAAAEWLIENGYTEPERLAIRGYSNGGLLVGAVITQRPDLFRAAICGFPDLDMVRFHRFVENNNQPALHEYGDAAIPEQFEFLRRYSPYQAIEKGTPYPAVMLTSGDLDTRVPPLQARKMAAGLQWATSSNLPVILDYDPRAGHAANRGVGFSQRIEDRAMELAFVMMQLGMGTD